MAEHYLKREFFKSLKTEDEIFEFLEQSSLDGIWYWDLERPENEWMSPNFWKTLGFDPDEKQHLAVEWQDLIFSEDLIVAYDNFEKHCADQNHPYDQVVRYYHADGSIVWVRCRGMAIRDENGAPVRLLGAHNEITELMEAREKIERQTEAEKQQDSHYKRISDKLVKQRTSEVIRLNKEIKNFAQLSEPLKNIQAVSDKLEQALKNDQTKQALKLVKELKKTAKRSNKLLNDLIQL